MIKSIKKFFADLLNELGIVREDSVEDILLPFTSVIKELDDYGAKLDERAVKREETAQKLLQGAAEDKINMQKADSMAERLEEVLGIAKPAPALPAAKANA